MDNHDNGGYQRTFAFSREYEKIIKPPQPEYLELINDGFVPEQREVRGNTGVRDDSKNESVRSETTTQYDYSGGQFVGPGIYNETEDNRPAGSKIKHSESSHNSRSVCECLRKYKLILIAAAIVVIIITVSVITVISLTRSENSEQSRNGDDESYQTTGGTVRGQQTTGQPKLEPTMSLTMPENPKQSTHRSDKSYQTTVGTLREEQTTGQSESEHTKHASLVIIGGPQ